MNMLKGTALGALAIGVLVAFARPAPAC